jgi:hypothetical protein
MIRFAGYFPGTALFSVILLTASTGFGQSPSTPIQMEISSLLNDRVVFTAAGGELQPAQHSVDTSSESALITHGAAEKLQAGEINALPDNDLFSGNERHPAIKLHYAQAGSQVHRITARTGRFSFEVPPNRYRRLQLFFISAQGGTPLEIHLIYADGGNGKRETVAPDFYNPPPNDDPRWFTLTGNLGKVNLQGRMIEPDHHALHGFDLNPDPTKKLLKVEVIKLDSASVLNFFGATGLIAESGHSKSSARRKHR